jgi:hypothetical protein
MPGYESVEFKTLDDVTLRGWLFPATTRGVGIVMSPGVDILFPRAISQN